MGQCPDQLGPIETPAPVGMGHCTDAALAGGRGRVGMVHSSSMWLVGRHQSLSVNSSALW